HDGEPGANQHFQPCKVSFGGLRPSRETENSELRGFFTILIRLQREVAQKQPRNCQAFDLLEPPGVVVHAPRLASDICECAVDNPALRLRTAIVRLHEDLAANTLARSC